MIKRERKREKNAVLTENFLNRSVTHNKSENIKLEFSQSFFQTKDLFKSFMHTLVLMDGAYTFEISCKKSKLLEELF